MPDIKHQFTGGKMNKDLDERLVPKGEYKDAMNIQVSTSEESSVGVVQNILGNTLGCTDYSINSPNPISLNSFTVGSVADEKNDSLYWLISGENYDSIGDIVSNNSWGDPEVVTMRDLIFRKTPSKCEPVFVDLFAFSTPNSETSDVNVLSGVPLSVLEQLQPGWTVTGVTDTGETSNTATITSGGVMGINSVYAGFESAPTPTPVTTTSYVGPNPMGVAEHVWIPMSQTQGFTTGAQGQLSFSYNQSNSNYVYISGFYTSPPTSLTGSTFTLFPGNGSNTQNFVITNQETVDLYLHGSVTSFNAIKLTLDNPVATFNTIIADASTAALNAGNASSNPSGEHLSSTVSGGINIDAEIETDTIENINFATGVLTIDTSDLNLNTLDLGDVVYKDSYAYCIRSIDETANSLILEDCTTGSIHDGWQVGGFIFGLPQPIGGMLIFQSQLEVQLSQALILSGNTYTSFLYKGPRTLNFNHDQYITGINIIDDMLFWTDGVTEPKKIHIPRSVEGCKAEYAGNVTGFEHTRLLNEAQGISKYQNVMVREEHITVIRKAPLSAPYIKVDTTAREAPVSGISVSFDISNYNGQQIGQNFNITTIDSNLYGFEIGDVILLSEEFSDLPGSYALRVEVISIVYPQNVANTYYFVKILSLSAPIVDIGAMYGELESISSFLFERKLPRFAYRYKYLDNEYSSFSPFTNVAFFPGDFNYEPIKAYNKGMENTIESLFITGFITPYMPKDVKSIDLLYKNETSPIIYLIDTVSNNDELTASGHNSWNSAGDLDYPNSNGGSYNVTNENISQALPSNQSLRSWDNVPKKALAQEISGNRIIYGNYTQGYEIKNADGKNISPDIDLIVKSNVVDSSDNSPKKSIKSLRNYEVGVVWGDKYGRETPVITSKSGSVLVSKNKSKSYNHLKASLNSSPSWAEYYRFYVKETSNEYYNLAVDRTYDAEDGNVWVSFPSIDRNKVDEDTYIILKKGSESEELITEESRYKIVAIENEAPEYIKTSYDIITRTNQDESRPTHSCNLWGGVQSGGVCSIYPENGFLNPPTVGKKSFSINQLIWKSNYNVFDASGDPDPKMGLPDLIDVFKEVSSNTIQDELYVSFTKETPTSDGGTTVVSGDKYHVIDVKTDPTDLGEYSKYIVYLDKPIGGQDDFVVQDSDTSTSGMQLQEDNIHVLFWKKSITNKPEFDGRFFVKILNDVSAQKHLSSAKETFNSWRSTDVDVYSIKDTGLTSNTTNRYDFNLSPTQTVGASSASQFWIESLKFDGSVEKSAWFIDNANFASIYEVGDTYTTDFANVSGATSTSCDLTSTLSTSFNYNAFSYNLATTISNANPSQFNFVYGSGIGFAAMSNVVVAGNGTTTPPIYSVGTGGTTGTLGMKGAHVVNAENYVILSYSLLGPSISLNQGGLAWDVGNPNTNTTTNDQKRVVDRLFIGSRFKLKGGKGIYKILGIEKHRVLNYLGAPSIELGGNQIVMPYESTGGTLIGGSYVLQEGYNQEVAIKNKYNKRLAYRIKYELDIYASPDALDPTTNLKNDSDSASNIVIDGINNSEAGVFQFLEEFNYDGENSISTNPAVFETEPKEDVGLDLYYEASSSLPVFPLNNKNKFLFMPIGTTIVSPASSSFPTGIFITGWNTITSAGTNVITLSTTINGAQYNTLHGSTGYIEFLRDDGTYATATLVGGPDTLGNNYVELSITPNNEYGLSWHNCWSFNNGVESNRIGDTFNKPYLSNGVTLSTTVENNLGEENRAYGLIYSGIYNSNGGVNNLNQFIAAEKITKDINPTYGSIQKLYAGWGKNGSLIALCEDRVLNILANKDALFNADGNTNVTSTNNVLGTATPYAGEHGISKNPESFASESYRIYFTDKTRGKVMRLSQDGLTPISEAGMKGWFNNNLKLSNKLVGSYDDRKDEYNITLNGYYNNQTVSFREDVRGWVSFKSFAPENAISCANEYYTFNNGLLWKHHDKSEDRNTFYKGYPSEGFTASSINVILNDQPSTIKTFHTLNYEGSQAKVDSFTNYDIYHPGTTIVDKSVYDNNYHNLSNKPGWHVQHVQTNQEKGTVLEFIEKEGKWFNYIKGKAGSVVNPNNASDITEGFNNADFSFQGLGAVEDVEVSNDFGCTDITAFNYNPTADLNDGSCIAVVNGCNKSDADNFNPLANTDDSTCVYSGCSDITAINYSPVVGHPPPLSSPTWIFIDDGSCIAPVYGCTEGETDTNGVPIMVNYNTAATVACDSAFISLGSPPCASIPWVNPLASNEESPTQNCCCVPAVYGCMDITASNYNLSANVNLTSSLQVGNPSALSPCIYPVPGCMDANACGYNSFANIDDSSCYFCTDPLANNYDGLAPDGDPYLTCTDDCLFCKPPSNLQVILGGPTHTSVNLTWDETWDGNAPVAYYQIGYGRTGFGITDYAYVHNIQPNVIQGSITHEITGLLPLTAYEFRVKAFCSAGTSVLNPLHYTISIYTNLLYFTTTVTPVYGCTDSMACNYDRFANSGAPNQYCDYTSCLGCTDSTATNYNATATIDDGSCAYVYGCMDSTALNYDPAAVADDGSCIARILGCMDSAQNNAGTAIAATDYNLNATVATLCNYNMPEQWVGSDPGTFSQLLQTPGWWSGGIWGGNYRRLRAIWDVSLAPRISSTMLLSYLQGATTSNFPGDITSFNVPQNIWYSNDNGSSWNPIANWNEGDEIRLVMMQQTNSGVVNYTGSELSNAQNFPPYASGNYTGEQQAAQFQFINPNTTDFHGQPTTVIDQQTHTTSTAVYNVLLGCDLANAWAGFGGNTPAFGNNDLCAVAGTVAGLNVDQNNVSINNEQLSLQIEWYYTFPANKVSWETQHSPANYPVPEGIEYQVGWTSGDGVVPSYSNSSFVNQVGYSSSSGGSPGGPIAYEGVSLVPTLNVTYNVPVTVPATPLSGSWGHFRVRWKRLAVGTTTYIYGPWNDTWFQVN